MTAELRDAQRDEFCQVLAMVPPDSPTLCAGWTAFDLAAHVWLLNHGPRSWLGIVLPPLAWFTTSEIRRVRQRFSYAGLVEEIRTGPASLKCMPTDSWEDHRHALGEYFIHTEDVRRPNRLPRQEISAELAEALLGTMVPVGGSITLDGTDITQLSPAKTLKTGLGYVPEDRHRDGFIGEFSIAQNLVLDNLDEFSHHGNLQMRRINENAVKLVRQFDIRASSHTQPAKSLSGGNQQKVVLARELSRPLSLLLANQPTRGVDVGAIEFLHNRIVAERDRGTAVLIISTELEEVESLADRIAVMYRGRIIGVVPPDTPREVLGLMMAGVGHDDAVATVRQEAGA